MHNSGYNNYAKEFFRLKKRFNCFLIEDACHALGAKIRILKMILLAIVNILI